MNIILLSGGSGKRLWPLSNEVRSKQFLSIFQKEDGTSESMLQRMYRMIHEVDRDARVTVASSENQVQAIKRQLGENIDISVEPCRRDTFPAIALAVSYLHDVLGVDSSEVAVVCPVDPYVDPDYFYMLKELAELSEKSEANLCLAGIEPTHPSEKYGYIIPETGDKISRVREFREKPDRKTAETYLSQGALWNAGVFAFKLAYVLDISEKTLGTANHTNLAENYENLEKISFDYAVVEKEENISVLRFPGQWKDLGTWDTLTEPMTQNVIGNAVMADCNNTHVINELQIPLIALGGDNLVIAATPDGILVADKNRSDKLKNYVTDRRPMFEQRIWGEYKVLDCSLQDDGNNTITKHLIISPGKHISYQRHFRRSEMWTVVKGKGKLILDGIVSEVKRGDTVSIKPEMKHAIKAETELHIIEVQLGDELTEEDIERLDFNWNNI